MNDDCDRGGLDPTAVVPVNVHQMKRCQEQKQPCWITKAILFFQDNEPHPAHRYQVHLQELGCHIPCTILTPIQAISTCLGC